MSEELSKFAVETEFRSYSCELCAAEDWAKFRLICSASFAPSGYNIRSLLNAVSMAIGTFQTYKGIEKKGSKHCSLETPPP